METKRRTWLKAVCWQIMGLITMSVVGFLITGSVAAGSVMAGINAAIGAVVYVIYERVWNRINWGRIPLDKGL